MKATSTRRHVIVPVTVNGTGIKGPMVGLGLGVTWGSGPHCEQTRPPRAHIQEIRWLCASLVMMKSGRSLNDVNLGRRRSVS